MEGQEKTTFN